MALREKRPTPSAAPRMVANTMPAMATRSVLRMPTRKAFQYGSSASYPIRVSPMSKPAGCRRKSKPLWIPRACMFASVLCARYHSPTPIRTTATSWKTRPRKAWLRQLNVLPDRGRIHEAPFVPQIVGSAREVERRLLADVAREDLAVVARGLEGPHHPVLVEAQQLARVLGGAQDAHHDRVLAGLHLVDVVLVDAVLLGLDEPEDHPLGDGLELVVAAPHRGGERLLGDELRQDHVLLRVLRVLVADRGEARGVGRECHAAPGEVRARRGLLLLEHYRLHVELVGAREIREVLLGRGPRLHAHGGALELLGALHLGLHRDHEALAVVVRGGEEGEAERCVAGQGPGGVARQDVHLAGLQRREALLGGERHPLHLVAVAGMAAAIARQTSTSRPVQLPWLSAA